MQVEDGRKIVSYGLRNWAGLKDFYTIRILKSLISKACTKTFFVQFCLFIMMIVTGSLQAVTVNIYSGHTQTRGGTPYSNLVGTLDSPDIMFWTNSNNYWFPFDLPNFGAEITGYLLVSETGNYEFEITYDDGCVVYIDDQEFMYYGSNGVYRGSKSIILTEGIHSFRIEFFEDWGCTSGIDFILPDGVQYAGFNIEKTDDVPTGQCRSPHDNIHYSLCLWNLTDQVLVNPFVIDRLPSGVDFDSFVNLAPPVISADYSEEDHSCRWDLEDIDPNGTSCLELSVTVNTNALPAGNLHNVAELWGTILVPDPNDPNIVYPKTFMVAMDTEDTPVCCWTETPDVLYVDKSAVDGAKNGLDWDNAFADLKDAVDYARSTVCGHVNSIYVAQGTYSPGDDEGDSFILSDNISLYGGFPTGGGLFIKRNPKANETVLTGRISNTRRNDTIVSMAQNTVLDGFTIKEASSDGQAIYGSGFDFTIQNSFVVDNWQYGIRAIDGNVTLKWCYVKNNRIDGILHEGTDHTLNIENCWISKNMQRGIFCSGSTPIIRNSNITESDLSEYGNAGLRMFNPAATPVLQNCTFAHNRGVGVSLAFNQDATNPNIRPTVQNCVVYHNNSNREQFAGFTKQSIRNSCIYDPNDPNGVNLTPDVNSNFTANPILVSLNPDDVHIAGNSPCKDAGADGQYANQQDMDRLERVRGAAVDVGAYEINPDCTDNYNTWDWNHDGSVNFGEFLLFAQDFNAHDPNDPAILDPNHPDHDYLTDPNGPGYINPSRFENWYTTAYRYNYANTGTSQYAIDAADLMELFNQWPWLWTSCWKEAQTGSNPFDFNGDGLINYYEFNCFAKAWFSQSPDDPQLSNPALAVNWDSRCNVAIEGDSRYRIDLADLTLFIENAPWLWIADWRPEVNNAGDFNDDKHVNLADLEILAHAWQSQSGLDNWNPDCDLNDDGQIDISDLTLFVDSPWLWIAWGQSSLVGSAVPVLSSIEEPTQQPQETQVEEPSIEQQIADLQDSIVFLENLWQTDPDIQQEIPAEEWQAFMDGLYAQLADLQSQLPQEPEPSIEQQIADLQDSIAFLENLWQTDENIQQETSAEEWQAFMAELYAQLADLESQLPSGDPNDLFDPNWPFFEMGMMSMSGLESNRMLDSSSLSTSQQEIADLQDSVQFLESLWDDSEVRQEIDVQSWNAFMKEVKNSLQELQSKTIQENK
jgi:hypothetical protein